MLAEMATLPGAIPVILNEPLAAVVAVHEPLPVIVIKTPESALPVAPSVTVPWMIPVFGAGVREIFPMFMMEPAVIVTAAAVVA